MNKICPPCPARLFQNQTRFSKKCQSARLFWSDRLLGTLKYLTFYLIQGCVDRDMWNRMGEQGFLGTSIAAEKGGIGGTFKDEAIVLEEQIYANCHAPAIGVSKAGLCILRRMYFSDTLLHYFWWLISI